MNKNVLIVNFNTTLLTQCCIKSVNKFTPGCKIYVFDNSDKEPFVNIFENVEVIDNTNGQIINWDEWLSKYKNKNKSNAKINRWGSAKHCYTVEKCMELINEPFVLLDSDVLLKKDITDLFDEKYVYVGKVEKQPNSTIKRVIPYCCYINTKMCKANKVHYFNENRMHGLYKLNVVKNGDSYDTGSNFYLESEKLQHKEIKYEEYVEHFSGGSWDEVKSKRINRKITDIEWLEINKKLWCKDINICIIHFNTPKLTECLIKSINKFVPSCKIYIFDSSDKEPFVYRQDNIIYFDNTKGQIINFEEWLNSIKTKVASPNKHASAKHCYTIQKCMELINEPFILLDSDVLLKKDITDLFDEKYVYVGDTEKWLGNDRVIPYCCYINTKMCRKNNINYFNEKYINGLSSHSKYDTGASFYLECKDLPNKKISYKEYVVHLDDGSQRYGSKDRQERFLNDNKKLWEVTKKVEIKSKNKKVIYTCISGNYDTLLEPEFISDGFDYVCFTDQPFTSNVWEIIPIPEELNNLSGVKRQRNIKINAHKYLSEYDFSVWVDANISLKGDINEYIEKNCNKRNTVLWVGKHPSRDCIYKESEICIKLKKDTKENINKQMEVYRKENFPEHYGLPQTCILLRYHNEESCKKLMETWWKQVEMYSHRDQLSFNYALWKNQDTNIEYLDKSIFNCETFKWGVTHKKSKFTNKKQSITEKINEVKIPHTSNTPTHSVEDKKKKLSERIREIRLKREKINGPNYFGEY